MFMARREAKWRTDSRIRAGQEGLTQRETTSPSGRKTADRQMGHFVGQAKERSLPVRRSFITETTCGMTSPLRSRRMTSPDADVLTAELVLVVERRAADRRAGELDGLEDGDRRQGPRPADLDDDVVDPGGRLPGRELVGDRPPRRLGRRPQGLPLVGRVDFDDDAVGLEIERVPFAGPFAVVGKDVVDRRAAPGVGIRPEAERPHPRQALPLGIGLPPVDEEGVEEDVQVPRRDLLRVEEADGPGRRVSRVGEEGLLVLLALPVDREEGFGGNVDLAPDLDVPGLGDGQGQGPDRLDVGGDVVAPDAVAARHGPGVLPVPVENGDAEPVDLELGHVRDLLVGKEPEDPVLEVPEPFLVVAVVDAQHRPVMDDRHETFDGPFADPPGGGFGGDEVGESRLEAAQLPHERVELGVGNLGVVVDVVFLFVVSDLPAQVRDLFRGGPSGDGPRQMLFPETAGSRAGAISSSRASS